MNYHVFFIALILTIFISTLNGENNVQNQNDEFDFDNENYNNEKTHVLDTIKRFLLSKKTTTTKKPSSDSIVAIVTTTNKPTKTSKVTKASIFSGVFGKKTSTTTTKATTAATRTSFLRPTSSSTADACGTVTPCKNGGTCKTLSSGRFYCFCTQDYYGKTCENKFFYTGDANNDRAAKNHCASSPCRNGGECVGLRTTYYCRCKTPHYGINCEKSL